ncbi:MAG: hypothetical protein IJO14_11745 [Clostridia bacterium]|nr:hypothetical protein [Clostridia bacterium]
MDKINEGITYVFGENAAVDGNVNADWAVDFFYNKDTPMFDDLFAKMRDTFWSLIKKLIELFK